MQVQWTKNKITIELIEPEEWFPLLELLNNGIQSPLTVRLSVQLEQAVERFNRYWDNYNN